MRLELKFGTVFPHIQTLNLAFLDSPIIDFRLKPLGAGDINSIKSINDSVRSIISSSISSFLVHPNYLPLNIEQMVNGEVIDVHEPLGLFRIIIFEARKLKNADIGSLSDPQVVCKLGGIKMCETRVIQNDLDPKFLQTFNIVLTKDMIAAGNDFSMEVRHKSTLTSSLLGKTSNLNLKWYFKAFI